MLKINLLPVREARRKADLRQYLMLLLLVVIVTVGGIGLVHSRLQDQIDRSTLRITQMEADIEQFKPQLEQVAAFKKRKAELEKKIDVIDGLDRARSGPIMLMSELATRTPDRLWLTGLVTKNGRITLKGESLDNEIVALFLRALGESEYFDDVDLDSTKLGSDRSGLKLVTFVVQAELVGPRPPKGKNKAKNKGKNKDEAKAEDPDEA